MGMRARFVLSHILPLLIITVFIGFALIYVLETQVLLNNITTELTAQALLLTQLTIDEPEVWVRPQQAQFFIARVDPLLSARIMLLDAGGNLLASSDPADQARLHQKIDIYDLPQVENGVISVRTTYRLGAGSELADVFAPVLASDGRLLGVVRLTYNLSVVYDRFLKVRGLIIGILAAGLLLGGVFGLGLALNLERPVTRLTAAVTDLAQGQQVKTIPEQGPPEIRTLVSAYNNLVERLLGMERSRKQLLANLVHELGRPLGALRSGIQALQGGAHQDPQLRDELLGGMVAEVDRLHRLTDDLAHLHDQLLGSLELNRQPFSMSEWLPRVLAPWREAAQAQRLRWSAEIPEALPTVNIDADRLGQAIGNLLSNAIKYTPLGGEVTVEAGVAGEAFWIKVKDTGPGIPFEEQDKVFIPFYRGQQRRRFPQGLGLGLSIARDQVTAHGGRLELVSAPGQGSQFTIYLPLQPKTT
jgi:two-component system sensor histidine kinase BaeS